MIFDYQKYEELRDTMNVTDYQVAKDTGVTKSTFTDWKTGRSRPKIDKIARIAEFFNVSINFFVSEKAG